MNYLAHLYLAEPTPPSLLGNLMADSVKGSNLSFLPEAVQAGVRMHRRVDAFTDCHPLVQRSISRISKNWGWYSGILIDVFYDHLLATSWNRYSNESLRDDIDRFHSQLLEGVPLVPSSREMIESLIGNDRLYSYSTTAGIADALTWIAQRLLERMPNREIHLERALPELVACRSVLEVDFHEFFAELVGYLRDRSSKSH